MTLDLYGSSTKLAVLAGAVATYFALAAWSIHTYRSPAPKGRIVFAVYPPFEKISGSEYQVNPITLPLRHSFENLDCAADSLENSRHSSLLLFENEQLLGPPHSLHIDIADLGRGRYSHWKAIGLRFSTSDNSDPNTNGRRYWAVIP